MARKKKSGQLDAATDGSGSSTPAPASNGAAAAKKAANEPSTSALIICRNK
jgi:hypothetical protein